MPEKYLHHGFSNFGRWIMVAWALFLLLSQYEYITFVFLIDTGKLGGWFSSSRNLSRPVLAYVDVHVLLTKKRFRVIHHIVCKWLSGYNIPEFQIERCPSRALITIESNVQSDSLEFLADHTFPGPGISPLSFGVGPGEQATDHDDISGYTVTLQSPPTDGVYIPYFVCISTTRIHFLYGIGIYIKLHECYRYDQICLYY